MYCVAKLYMSNSQVVRQFRTCALHQSVPQFSHRAVKTKCIMVYAPSKKYWLWSQWFWMLGTNKYKKLH